VVFWSCAWTPAARARTATAMKEAMKLTRKRINTSLQDRAERGQRERGDSGLVLEWRPEFSYGSQCSVQRAQIK